MICEDQSKQDLFRYVDPWNLLGGLPQEEKGSIDTPQRVLLFCTSKELLRCKFHNIT